MKYTNNYFKTTAILLFALNENAQSVSKPIACQKKQKVLLWKNMNERVLKTIQKTKLPYFISDETNQIGNTFGQKISFAIQKVIYKGFDNVIVIGNDCIELQSKYLLEASNKLKTNDVIFGPDFNGGAYLIGVSKSSFDIEKFAAISWQTCTVFNELKELYCNHNTAFLPGLNDCNSTPDFKKVIHRLSYSNPFRHLIFSLLQDKFFIHHCETTFVSYEKYFFNFNKGSPFSVQILV
ncbi:hypothetical protein EV196_11257 [Mariniflexile fucanivorans]|uniref:DUF2064 domain-containing protein n=1 Tax=Mariniflexile fucanivorans TaxID=264023 RepID=A0A4R1RAN1_9FLAO|nr:DUF2064 domain-containing protein [Mariniflexile fucanivorans]TCL62660.1 hypothetical protein EV196_11257 [Mariniflexile fucanivorans]